MGMLHHKLTEPVCWDLKAMNAVHGKYNEEKQQKAVAHDGVSRLSSVSDRAKQFQRLTPPFLL